MSDATTTPKLVTILGWAGRLITAAVFLIAGAHKLLDPAAFAEDIANYQAFPHWSWNLAATIVPVTEVLCALALLVDVKRRAAVIVLGSLTVAFIGLIASVIVRGINLECGCFGEAAEASIVGWPLLLRDLALLLAIIAAYLPPPKQR